MAQYLKPDSALGYVEDSAEIEALKFNNVRHVVLGCMLGDFNEVGDYIISPDIVNELISMEKYIVQTFDNIELCKSALKLDKQISFMVTFEGNRASLILIEKINYEANFALNSGVYSNINEYVLDYVETSGEINRNVIYDRWNIKPYGGNVIDIFNCDDNVLEKYFGIVNRFKYLLNSNKILLEKEEEIEEIESGYINEMFAVLSHYPKLKEQVENSIKESLKENKNSVSVKKAYFAKTLNEILENSINKNIDVLEENEKLEFEKEKRNLIVDLNVKRIDAIEIIQENDETSNKETSPKLIRLKPDVGYEKQTISELGIKLVDQDKKVFRRINGEETSVDDKSKVYDLIRRTAMAVGEKKGNNIDFDDEISQSSKGEKNKLIESLIGLGVAEEINAKKKTVEKQQEKEEVKEVKSASETKPKQVKKDEKKGEKAQKASGGKKPAKGEKTKSKDKPKDKAEDKKEEKKEELPFRRSELSNSQNKTEEDKDSNSAGRDANATHSNQPKERVTTEILSNELLSAYLGEGTTTSGDKKTKVVNNNNTRNTIKKTPSKINKDEKHETEILENEGPTPEI